MDVCFDRRKAVIFFLTKSSETSMMPRCLVNRSRLLEQELKAELNHSRSLSSLHDRLR